MDENVTMAYYILVTVFALSFHQTIALYMRKTFQWKIGVFPICFFYTTMCLINNCYNNFYNFNNSGNIMYCNCLKATANYTTPLCTQFLSDIFLEILFWLTIFSYSNFPLLNGLFVLFFCKLRALILSSKNLVHNIRV